jgi:hypothetical protein
MGKELEDKLEAMIHIRFITEHAGCTYLEK